MKTIIVVEIPHTRKPSAYFTTLKELVFRAKEENNNSTYHVWTSLKELQDCFGEDIPLPARHIIAAQDAAVEVNNGGAVDWYSLKAAPSPEEWAYEVLFGDLHSYKIFDDPEEAEEWATSYRGHQWPQATSALEKELIQPI